LFIFLLRFNYFNVEILERKVYSFNWSDSGIFDLFQLESVGKEGQVYFEFLILFFKGLKL
jgi:hypothetical protein